MESGAQDVQAHVSHIIVQKANHRAQRWGIIGAMNSYQSRDQPEGQSQSTRTEDRLRHVLAM